MGWMYDLYQTYDFQSGHPAGMQKAPLLPPAHSVQRAHIELCLDSDAKAVNGRFLSLAEALTIIPCTEDSAGRGAGVNPHGLYDKLIYVAGDFDSYFQEKRALPYFQRYCENLRQWCDSPYGMEEVRVIYRYVLKRRLIQDLIDFRLLNQAKGRVSSDWLGESENKPVAISETFIRFVVLKKGEKTVPCNQKTDLFEAYKNYYISTKTDKRICYVTGQCGPYTDKHPSKLRSSSDNTKLISSNDTRGFTYRGRFETPTDTVTVGYEVSQKAHNALRWLIDNQGMQFGEMTLIAWGIRGGSYPSLAADGWSIAGEVNIKHRCPAIKTAYQELIRGLYEISTPEEDRYIVLGLAAATQGRLSICYYSSLQPKQFLENYYYWHGTCCWIHRYKYIAQEEAESHEDEPQKGRQSFRIAGYVGAPSPADIIGAVYSTRIGMKSAVDSQVKRRAMECLLNCILHRRKLPFSFVQHAIQHAANPVLYEKWEVEKQRSITCALIKKYEFDHKGTVWDMTLEESCREPSYVLGRLMACAHYLEGMANRLTGTEIRYTAVQRLQREFILCPGKVWRKLQQPLRIANEVVARRGQKGLQEKMHQIAGLLERDKEVSGPLKICYLLGYDCQLAALEEEYGT